VKIRPALALGAAVLLAGGVGFGAYRARVHAMSRYVPPVFVEPPPGQRAPKVDFLGVRLGATHLADVEKTMGAWHVACADRGMRVLMKELRDAKRAEVARAEAAGTPDAVTGASIVSHHSARDDNPQVRYACNDVASGALLDRPRAASEGRALFVFDAPDSVVRHASYQRHHAAWADAFADFEETKAAFTGRFGEGREAGNGAHGKTASDAVPKYARRTTEWRYTDLVVRVSVVNLGGRGFSLEETVEVPLPVRADQGSPAL
jgi:hypothetical protein